MALFILLLGTIQLEIWRFILQLGIARQIQPHPRPMLAEGGGRQQPIHKLFVGARIAISDELIHLIRGWRQSGEIQRYPSYECVTICAWRWFQPDRFEPFQNETIDWIARPAFVFHFRKRWSHRFHVRPMSGVRRSLRDPLAQRFDLNGAEFLAG